MNIKNPWINQLIDTVDASTDQNYFGSIPHFNISQFSEKLAKLFPQEELILNIISGDFFSSTLTFKSLGTNPTVISLELQPLQSPFFISFTSEDLNNLSKLLLSKETTHSFHESELLKGFFKFFFLKSLEIFREDNQFEGLSIKLSDQSIKSEDSYVTKINLTSSNNSLFFNMIFPRTFQEELKTYYTSKKIPLEKRLNFTTLSMELLSVVGFTHLKKHELEEIKVGDLVLLEHCSYQPKLKKGYFKIYHQNLPLFQAKAKEDYIKILDFIDSGESQGMKNLDSSKSSNDDYFFEEDHMNDEHNIYSDDQHHKNTEKLINPDQIDLPIFCEIGRFNMSLEKLLQLRSGSTIPLSNRPEEGVYLTLNQKKIARGELVQLGDIIGVKILETF